VYPHCEYRLKKPVNEKSSSVNLFRTDNYSMVGPGLQVILDLGEGAVFFLQYPGIIIYFDNS
jgi:hypothetical protein